MNYKKLNPLRDATTNALSKRLLQASSVLREVENGRSLTAIGQSRPDQNLALSLHVLRWYGPALDLLQQLHGKSIKPKALRSLLITALSNLWPDPQFEAYTLVDQCVSAARKLTRSKQVAGWVNALLRRAIVARPEWQAQDTQGEWSFPEWWVRRLAADAPEGWQQTLRLAQSAPPLCLRVNRRKCSRDALRDALHEAGHECELVQDLPTAIVLRKGALVPQLPGYQEGWFSIQDVNAQRAVEWLDLQNGQRVLDACAAPGGKSCQMAEAADIDLLAIDLDPNRCVRIEENCSRLDISFRHQVADAVETNTWWDGIGFDRILLDAPCTASGVVRRHPDIRWLRRESDVDSLVSTQLRLLAALWPTLAVRGKLLYVVCSVFRQEGDAVIERFVKENDAVEMMISQRLLPDTCGDGFFMALLCKRERSQFVCD